MKKFFLLCLMILLGVQCSAAAKDKGLPEEQRIKIAVEIMNTSRYKELPTATLLETFLNDKLVEKNLVNVLDSKILGETKPFDEGLIRDEDTTVDTPNPAENIGELLIFDAIELPPPSGTPKNFDADAYKNLGAAYVVRCEILGIGASKVEDKTIGAVTSIVGGGLSFGGGNGSSHRDKTLRRVGTAVGLLGFGELLDVTKRTALNTVVLIQFINVETGQVVWQEHFTGQAIKHHRAKKTFDNVWEQAYTESVEDSAKRIAKRVNKYVDKVIVKGKSDKSFLPKKNPFGKGLLK